MSPHFSQLFRQSEMPHKKRNKLLDEKPKPAQAHRSWRERMQDIAKRLPKVFTLTSKPKAMSKAVQRALAQPRTFHRFLDLPPELRERVYEYYFADTELAAKAYPQQQHAKALLTANKQLSSEAKAVMYRTGSFTIRLSPSFARNLDHDLAYWIDHTIKPGDHFSGNQEVLTKFSSFDLILDAPPHTDDSKSDTYWQSSLAILITSLHALHYRKSATETGTNNQPQNIRMRINIGTLDPASSSTETLTHLAIRLCERDNFRSWKKPRLPKEKRKPESELLELSTGAKWKAATPANIRERLARLCMVYYLGQSAWTLSVDMRIQSDDGKKAMVLGNEVETPAQVLGAIQKAGAGAGSWWVVVEQKGKVRKEKEK